HSAVPEVVTLGPSRDPLRLGLAAPLLPKSHGTLRPESRREVVVNGQFPSAKVSDCAQYSGNSAQAARSSPPAPRVPCTHVPRRHYPAHTRPETPPPCTRLVCAPL